MQKAAVSDFLQTDRRDTVFDDDAAPAEAFTFNAKVASVFDDMVSRSVPFYLEMQRMTCDLARDFAQPGTRLYDIGCSTATTMLAMDGVVDRSVRFTGVDNSADMIDKARQKVVESGTKRPIDFVNADLNQGVFVENASVITMLLTLQFIRPLHRERLMRSLYAGLAEQGALILIEKLTCEDSTLNRLFIEHYYEFKKGNGYSQTEIVKKREALENVLIPYRYEENLELLKSVGFRSVEPFFRWYNFCGIVAVR